MSEYLDLGVEHDHIEAMTKSSGTNALVELIWNSLDADATEVRVSFVKSNLEGYEEIIISDNGHGLTHAKAKLVFAKLGGSDKKISRTSPNGREYHGKEGRGRYKSLALGDDVEFISVYRDGSAVRSFNVRINRNQLRRTELNDPMLVSGNSAQPGYRVVIHDVNHERAEEALRAENRRELEEKFAAYWITYQNFQVFFNGTPLAFASLIKHQEEKVLEVEKDGEIVKFTAKVVQWNIDTKKRAYLCNRKGIPFAETNIGLRPGVPVSLFLQSDFIEQQHRDGTLEFHESNVTIQEALKQARSFTRDYVRRRMHESSKTFIEELKRSGLYPYKGKAEGFVEQTKRQVFDIVALQINEYLPSFASQDDASKRLTLGLVSQALDHDAKNLQKVLTEFIGLPENKRQELSDILETTSLSSIIDTMTVIRNRLNFLNGLEQIIYDTDLSKHVLERKHLHKIVVNETWIFGDEYTYGVDDVTLQNVLKAYLKDCLGRTDLEEVVDEGDNTELQRIPDVCLWHQYSMGTEWKENLVIELKRPTVNAGMKEKGQIESYASRVSRDNRFPKDQTRWRFILVTKDIDDEVKPLLKQRHRAAGHVSDGDNFDVYILDWGQIITTAKTKLEFIKKKLNMNLEGNEAGLDYLRTRYKEYLPDQF
jgi:hypothetical protein